jgi:hypothetical protein
MCDTPEMITETKADMPAAPIPDIARPATTCQYSWPIPLEGNSQSLTSIDMEVNDSCTNQRKLPAPKKTYDTVRLLLRPKMSLSLPYYTSKISTAATAQE